MAKNTKDFDLKNLCDAVLNSIEKIKELPQKTDIKEKRSLVKTFQEEIQIKLCNSQSDYDWKCEYQEFDKDNVNDRIDIVGKPKNSNEHTWVIEIDATRADQLAKKMLSRFALFKDKNMMYVAIIYPGTKSMSVPECDKYIQYGYEVLKKMNGNNDLKAIYITQLDDNTLNDHSIDIISPNKRFYYVHGYRCKNMAEAVQEAANVFLNNNKSVIDLINKAEESEFLKSGDTNNHNGDSKVFSKDKKEVMYSGHTPKEVEKDNEKLYISAMWRGSGPKENFSKIVEFFKKLKIDISKNHREEYSTQDNK